MSVLGANWVMESHPGLMVLLNIPCLKKHMEVELYEVNNCTAEKESNHQTVHILPLALKTNLGTQIISVHYISVPYTKQI